MRRPKGIKTKKSVTKRFKVTGTGKVLFRGAGKRHLLQGKVPSGDNRYGKPPSSDRLMSIASNRIFHLATKAHETSKANRASLGCPECYPIYFSLIPNLLGTGSNAGHQVNTPYNGC